MRPLDNLYPTAELQRLDAAHHMHPFTHNSDLGAKGARVIVRANGAFLTDSEGVEILDAMAGLWCVNVGYGRRELAEAAAAQMQELPYYNTFFQTTHPPVIALAAKLAALAPGDLNHVFFACSGSEANDTNIRLVRQYWAEMGRPTKRHIISRRNAYHGSSMGSASLGGMAGMHTQGGMPIPDISHIDQPYWYGEAAGEEPEAFALARAHLLAAEIDRIGADNVAAFIGEPVQGAGAVIIPHDAYWPEVERICRERDILLIADEVICGFGRTGNWFGSQTLGFTPDIMTVAKGLSSGYQPIGGSIVSDRVASVIDRHEFNHGYTYSGHPVACAVALENLRIIEEENLVGHVRDTAGPYLARRWAELGEHPLVGEARSIGLMGALELTADKATRRPFPDPGTVGLRCREACFGERLVMRHVRDTMIISPPLIVGEAEIDLLVTRARAALDRTYAGLKADGWVR
ncbi:MAG: aspartate aminotransferase family protein [Pseudomonadota bacterium]